MSEKVRTVMLYWLESALMILWRRFIVDLLSRRLKTAT